jgi:hypothetical protein
MAFYSAVDAAIQLSLSNFDPNTAGELIDVVL